MKNSDQSLTASHPPYPPALPDYQPTLTIDAGCVVVTVCGQPSREDAEAMAALLVAVCERLKDVRA